MDNQLKVTMDQLPKFPNDPDPILKIEVVDIITFPKELLVKVEDEVTGESVPTLLIFPTK
jgi:hypothetical protein